MQDILDELNIPRAASRRVFSAWLNFRPFRIGFSVLPVTALTARRFFDPRAYSFRGLAAPNEVKRQHEMQGATILAPDEKLLSKGTEIRFPLRLTLVQPNKGSL